MKIPYGIANFKSLRQEGYLYVDKTKYIEKLESFGSKYLFFIRPRRFGKSLFLSTLEHYYDIRTRDEFDVLFKELYIGQNPTPLRNKYLILNLDFSGLYTENKTELAKSFRTNLITDIERFIFRYKNILKDSDSLEEMINACEDSASVIKKLISEVEKVGEKIYLIIDEYDHFANDIIAMGDGDFYKDITRATGFVRKFYEMVKWGAGRGVIDRIFITGISPIMLDDLTSGFNIAANITMRRELNEMLGFTHEEVLDIWSANAVISPSEEEKSIKLKEYYNGYLFNMDADRTVYNPDMVLYYFDNFVKEDSHSLQLIDDNVKTDYGRLNRLVANEANKNVLEEIIKDEEITANLVARFSFDRMYDQEYFVSLLFYLGMLTIHKKEKTRLILKIPNYVIKTIYWEYVKKRLERDCNISEKNKELKLSIEEMAYAGKVRPFVEFINANVLNSLSNRDLMAFDEKHIKMIILSYLNVANAYVPISEREVEKGYIDMYFEKRMDMPDIKYEWVIELKYVKKEDRGKFAEIKENGLKQLEKYAESRGVKHRQNVKRALIIFIGKDEYDVHEC